jgi:hypothetical protein
LGKLVGLSRELGRPEHDYGMLAAGTTALIRAEQSFWVQACGKQLRTVVPSSLAAVRVAPVVLQPDASIGSPVQ